MVTRSQAKVLLLIACVAGGVQGLLTFVGGCVATYDKHKDAETAFLGAELGDTKYQCGYIRLKRVPRNVQTKDEDCDGSYGIMDRGWYSRVHKFCLECSDDECDTPACDLNGFGVVLACAIVCGAGWFLAAVAAFIGFLLNHRKTGIVVFFAFIVFYIIFIGLFGAAWASVRKLDRECLNKACKEVRTQGKRSSREFLAYSICSFFTILAAIICSGMATRGLGKPAKNSNNQPESDDKGESKKEVVSVKDYDVDGKECYIPEDAKEEAKAENVTIVGREYIYKFNQLNKYIADQHKLHMYAKKKFAEIKKSKETVTIEEFKEFVIELMQKKGLPFPSENQILYIMGRYDTKENDKLDASEFEQLLLDMFIESRELLIVRYAAKKANSWKFDKVFAASDSPNIKELEEVLTNSEELSEVLEEIVKHEGKNMTSTFSIDEVTEIAKLFCEKYRVPVLNKVEVTEVVHDMGKEAIEFDVNDLRMAVYAVLDISKSLVI
eukprot:TRINITY_DN13820_c0_g1_i3.p1 TRINITY_DN13820_c0_g1~~TRINITY_DN13820_c0_g1_i3.p1  ORF type:complete len:495 (+),score=141.04 TRINITY_DN13820_c0_g1_i3:111-1595(+)